MNEEKECNIVKDLLPSFIDDVLTEDSKEFVEEHLKRCSNCQNILQEIKKELNQEQKYEKTKIDYLKSVNKKINFKNRIIKIVSAFLIIIIVFNLYVWINYINKSTGLEIFLANNITIEQRENIETVIKKVDNNAIIQNKSKEDALEGLKEKFGDKAYLLDGYEKENNPLPESIIVQTQFSKVREIQENIINLEGIRTVVGNIERSPYEVFIIEILDFLKNF